MLKIVSHESFGHLQHKSWSKEGSGIKLAIWLPTTKSSESTRSRYVQVECDTPLERSWRELQLCFRLHPNSRLELEVLSFQSPGNPNQDSFRTPPWESRDKKPFGCRSRWRTHRLLYGGRWWLPPSPGHGESSESVLPMACPNTKGDPECGLTNLWLVLMQDRVAKYVVPQPSLIPELLARPSHPPLVLEAGSGIKFQLLPHLKIIGPSLGLTRNLGALQI
jgi:hypothetical protein